MQGVLVCVAPTAVCRERRAFLALRWEVSRLQFVGGGPSESKKQNSDAETLNRQHAHIAGAQGSLFSYTCVVLPAFRLTHRTPGESLTLALQICIQYMTVINVCDRSRVTRCGATAAYVNRDRAHHPILPDAGCT